MDETKQGLEKSAVTTQAELETLLGSLHTDPSKNSLDNLLNFFTTHEVVSKSEYARSVEEKVNMHNLLNKELRPEIKKLRTQLASHNLIYTVMKGVYQELKDVPLEEMPEATALMVDKLVKERERYEQSSLTDRLTHLPNLAYFEQSFEGEISAAQKKRKRLCLAYIDLDHFKQANDSKHQGGHATGDTLLKQFAYLARENLPKSYELCRIGGEEFAIIISDESIDPKSNEEKLEGRSAYSRLESLRKQVEKNIFKKADDGPYQHHNEQGGNVPFTISVGLVEYNGRDSMHELRKKADDALYKAKHEGRNRIEIFGEKSSILTREPKGVEPLLTRVMKAGRYILTGQ